MLPKKKVRPRSGIERAPKRVWNRHRTFVRKHCCCVPGCEDGPIEFAHVRTAANSGVGIKPIDGFAVSLCRAHHDEQHNIGALTFQAKYGIDLFKLADEFTRRSPDIGLREAMRSEDRER